MVRWTKLVRPGIARALLLGSLVGSVLLLYPALAFAQEEPPPPTALERLSDELLNILIPAAVLLVGGLVTWVLRTFSKKLGIEVSEANVTAWSDLARRGALRAAEWARKEVKEKVKGTKIPGPQMLEVAANWAIDMGKQMKLPEIGRARLEGLIESELFNLRREDSTTEVLTATVPPRI
jgi:hypothetical protein